MATDAVAGPGPPPAAGLTITDTVFCWGAAPGAVAATTIGYAAGARVAEAVTVSVQLSGSLAGAMLAARPSRVPLIVYVMALVRPPVRAALMDVAALPPSVRVRVGSASVSENARWSPEPGPGGAAGVESHAAKTAAARIVTSGGPRLLTRRRDMLYLHPPESGGPSSSETRANAGNAEGCRSPIACAGRGRVGPFTLRGEGPLASAGSCGGVPGRGTRHIT